jgi:alpha-galactosidase
MRKTKVRKESLGRGIFRYAGWCMDHHRRVLAAAIAQELRGGRDATGFPAAESWLIAPPIRFAKDWQGKNEDTGRETEVRILWTPEMLWLQFRCRYRSLTVFDDSDPGGRRDQLWDRDVAEVFLQPQLGEPRRYWEFEIAPNGMWIDLDISPVEKRNPQSGMKSRVIVDNSEKLWIATIALPTRELTEVFDPGEDWRVNFFRVEGQDEPRFYSAWQPTHTPQPNFHVPEAFGILRFQKA